MTMFVLEQDEEIPRQLNIPVLFICWMREVKDFLQSISEGQFNGRLDDVKLLASKRHQDWVDMYWGGFKGREDYEAYIQRKSQKGLYNMLTSFLLLFVGLKLANIITWSWLWVLSPLWIETGIYLIALVFFIIYWHWFEKRQ